MNGLEKTKTCVKLKTMKKAIKIENITPPSAGEVLKGKIIGKEKSAVFLDLENFGTGIIYGRELNLAKSLLKNMETGSEVLAKILNIDNEEGYVELSVAQASKEMAWKKLEEIKAKNETITVLISKANKGGLMTEIEAVPGFLPVSQLSPEHYPRIEGGDRAEILKSLQGFIGQKLKVKILSLDSRQDSLILSEKATRVEQLEKVLKNYQVGDVVEGKITAAVDFGVFIEFPISKKEEAVEGLIHISELDWQLIQDPLKVVKVGQNVKAKIIEISNGKASLSLKALKKDPWEDIEKKYKKEEVVKGEVIKFNPFGAFVKIEPKIQGLVHISEFGSKEKMKEKLELGKKYKFQVLSISPKEHRMILKLA